MHIWYAGTVVVGMVMAQGLPCSPVVLYSNEG